jgi:AraC family transcriptional regulator, melibiose operon regulatory protein
MPADHANPTQYGLNVQPMDLEVMEEIDQHQDVEINYQVKGHTTYVIGGETVELEPAHMLVFWSILPHRVVSIQPDSSGYYVHLPLVDFLRFDINEEVTKTIARCGTLQIPSHSMAEFDKELFALWSGENGLIQSSRSTHAQVLLEIETRLRRIDLGAIQQAQAVSGGIMPPQVARMAQVASELFSDPDLSVGDVAAEVGLSEKYAMTLFKKHLGVTIHDFITQNRIAFAQHLLGTTSDKVLAVAMTSGFNSQSVFYEAFRRIVGPTPNEYRKSLR